MMFIYIVINVDDERRDPSIAVSIFFSNQILRIVNAY